MCEADNGVEPSLIKVVRLLVHQQAQFADELRVVYAASDSSSGNSSPEQLVSSRQGTRIVRAHVNASQLRLLCEPHGELPMQLDWLKDGQLVHSSNSNDAALAAVQQQRYHVSTRKHSQRANALESELVVVDVRRQDAGVYECRARNAFGQAERYAQLVVQEPPEPPELVDVAHLSSRSVAMRWLAPFDGHAHITKYVVEYRKLGHAAEPGAAHAFVPTGRSEKLIGSPNNNKPTDLDSSQQASSSAEQANSLASVAQSQQQQQQLQHTVHELEPLTRYAMRVVAVNALGRSRPSGVLVLRTEEEGEYWRSLVSRCRRRRRRGLSRVNESATGPNRSRDKRTCSLDERASKLSREAPLDFATLRTKVREISAALAAAVPLLS